MNWTCIFVFVLVSLPLAAGAQARHELSDTQRSYNEQGVAAISSGDYTGAITKFQSSLTLGDANITFLNLGRAYQRNGDCLLAKQTYSKVTTAPAVPAPTPDEILSVLRKYSGELPDACPVRLSVSCSEPATNVTLDGGAEAACGAALVLETTPGEHRVIASLSSETFEKRFSAEEGESIEIAVAFADDVATVEPTTTGPEVVEELEAPESSGALATVGLATAIGGGALIGTALVLEGTRVRRLVKRCDGEYVFEPGEERCNEAKAESAQTTNIVLYGIGGGLAVVGTILFIVGQPSDGAVSMTWADGPGIAFTRRF